jgi:hypothetical protein
VWLYGSGMRRKHLVTDDPNLDCELVLLCWSRLNGSTALRFVSLLNVTRKSPRHLRGTDAGKDEQTPANHGKISGLRILTLAGTIRHEANEKNVDALITTRLFARS